MGAFKKRACAACVRGLKQVSGVGAFKKRVCVACVRGLKQVSGVGAFKKVRVQHACAV